MIARNKSNNYLVIIIMFTWVTLLIVPVTMGNVGDESGLYSWIFFSGYLKEMVLFSWNTESKTFTGKFENWDSLTHFRLRINMNPTDNVEGSIHLKNQVYWGDTVADPLLFQRKFSKENTSVDMTWYPIDEEKIFSRFSIDRLYLRIYNGSLETTIGRQRIAWGTALIWNPFDLFNPLSVLDIDNEEKLGADAFSSNYYQGTATVYSFVYVPDRNKDQSTVAVKAKTNRWDYDMHVMGGWFSGNTIVGLAYAGDVKGAGFRGETTYTFTDSKDDYLVVSVEMDYTWKNSLYCLGAYLYNGAGENNKYDYNFFQYSSKTLPYLALHYAYIMVGYDVTPVVRANMGYLQNLSDNSLVLIPTITYNVKQNLDLTLGALITQGNKLSEYGELPSTVYGQFKYYF